MENNIALIILFVGLVLISVAVYDKLFAPKKAEKPRVEHYHEQADAG